MTRRMKKLAMFAALLILAACAMSGTESADVTMSATRTDNRLMLTLRNGSKANVDANGTRNVAESNPFRVE
jgi:hypothetical protein